MNATAVGKQLSLVEQQTNSETVLQNTQKLRDLNKPRIMRLL